MTTERDTFGDLYTWIVDFSQAEHRRDVSDLLGLLIEHIARQLPVDADRNSFDAGVEAGTKRGYAAGYAEGERRGQKAVPRPNVVTVERDEQGRIVGVREENPDGTESRRSIERDPGGRIVRVVAVPEDV